MIHGVLTGDLVQSTRLSGDEIAAAMTCIQQVLQDFDSAGGHFTRYRGDGWQALLHDPSTALDVALVIIANLRAMGLATRVSIGIGEVDSKGTQTLSDAMGAAFTASGHALDQMQKGQLLAISGQRVKGEDQAIIAFLDERIRRWSREQAEAVAKTLDPKIGTDRQAARLLGISPQAMSDRLSNAGYPTMHQALAFWRVAKIHAGWREQ